MSSLRVFSQFTCCVSCRFSSETMSLGLHPGRMGSAEAFIQTECMGLFMCCSSSSKAPASSSAAPCMSGVWKAEVPMTLACIAPAFMARGSSLWMAAWVPPTDRPAGKSCRAISQTPSGPALPAASLQSGSSFALSSPTMEIIAWAWASAALVMASPRALIKCRPTSKEKAPAAQRAAYSPTEKPTKAAARSTASSFWPRSTSRPASPAMYMRGWATLFGQASALAAASSTS
mmetsp:Transcript_16520/g.47028  ORF Transcript_16520/g.47028 Transcript_16520/m.47028 type:complete len:232 (+) Transcript_16520:236-931(+)